MTSSSAASRRIVSALAPRSRRGQGRWRPCRPGRGRSVDRCWSWCRSSDVVPIPVVAPPCVEFVVLEHFELGQNTVQVPATVIEGKDMPNPLEGVDQSNDPYIIVSSDTHAGLYVEDYAYLESSVHAEFDEWLQTRHEHRAMVEEMNGEYVEQWEQERWGSGRLRPRDPRQGTRCRRHRRRGDLRRRRRRDRHGGAAVWRRSACRCHHRHGLGRRPAHNRWPRFCASNPRRGCGPRPDHPRCRGVGEEVYALADKPGIKGIMIPTMWHDAGRTATKYDPIWQACHETGLVVHTHSGEADAEAYNENMAQYMLEVRSGPTVRCGSSCSRGSSTSTRTSTCRSSAGRGGSATSSGKPT